MDFTSIETIKQAGFYGFVTIESLNRDMSNIPHKKGLYLVLRINQMPCEYLEIGTGGFFKQKNPNVSLLELQRNWVDEACVVYIGKAGKDGGNATLKSRLRQYLKFGQGQNIGHWGGRLIWQLKDVNQLTICWKTLDEDDPRQAEKELIQAFVKQYGKRPFANLAN